MPGPEVKVTFLGDAKPLQDVVGSVDGMFGRLGGALSGHLGSIAAAASFTGVATGLYNLGSTFDEAFDSIRVKTGATGDALAGLQNDMKSVFSNVPASAADVGDAIASLNQRLGLTGQPLQELSTQFLNLSRVTGTDAAGNIEVAAKAFNNWGIEGEEQGKTLDWLFKVSQQTGVGFQQLAQDVGTNGVVLRQAGLGFDASAALLGQLSKAGLEAADVMPAFSKAMARAAVDGEPAGEAIQGLLKLIKDTPNDTIAAQYAMDTFGSKAGPKLAAAIREGKLDYEGLMKTLAESPETINGAADDTADFAEKWEVFKNRILVGLEPIASRVFGAVGDGMERISEIASQVAEGFRAAGGGIEGFLAGVQNAVVLILESFGVSTETAIRWGDRVAGAFRTVIDVVQVVVGWLNEHRAVAIALGIAIAAVVAPVATAVAAFAALVAGVVYAYNHFEGFRNFVQEAMAAVQAIIETTIDIIRTVIETTLAAIEAFWRTWGGTVTRYLEGLWNAMRQIVEGAINVIRGVIETVLALIHGDWSGAWDGIKRILSGVWEMMNGIVDYAINSVRTIIEAGMRVIAGVFDAIWDNIAGIFRIGMRVSFGIMTAGMSELILFIWKSRDDIIGFFRELPDKLGDVMRGMADIILWPFRTAFTSIARLWNSTVGQLSFEVPGWIPGIGGRGWSAPKIPEFHGGGIVPGAGEQLAMLQGGEGVFTPEQMRALGGPRTTGNVVNLTVNVSGGLGGPDRIGAATADAVRRELSVLLRGAVA